MIHRENIEWCDIWIESGHEDTKPRVLLIGDSITRSYYQSAKKLISEQFACARIASSKCVAEAILKADTNPS